MNGNVFGTEYSFLIIIGCSFIVFISIIFLIIFLVFCRHYKKKLRAAQEQFTKQLEKNLEIQKQSIKATRKKEGLESSSNILIISPCVICAMNQPNTSFIPCGHVFCEICAEKLKLEDSLICPICRNPVSSSQQIYFP